MEHGGTMSDAQLILNKYSHYTEYFIDKLVKIKNRKDAIYNLTLINALVHSNDIKSKNQGAEYAKYIQKNRRIIEKTYEGPKGFFESLKKQNKKSAFDKIKTAFKNRSSM